MFKSEFPLILLQNKNSIELNLCLTQQKIEDEMSCLVKLGIYEPIPTSQWVAPIVPVFKSDGSICIVV